MATEETKSASNPAAPAPANSSTTGSAAATAVVGKDEVAGKDQAAAVVSIGPVDTGPGGSNKAFFLQLVALFLTCAVVVWGTALKDKQLERMMPEYKSFASVSNEKPSGMSAFFELCQSVFKNRKVSEWVYPYRKLNDRSRTAIAGTEHGVLIIVSPDESLAEFEVEDILDWVKKGNALIYFDNFNFSNTRRVLDRLDVTTRDLDERYNNRQSDERTGEPLYEHLRLLNLSAQQKLSGGRTLASIDGTPVMVQKDLGEGKVLIASCPTMVVNRQISLSDHWPNFQFLCNWISTTSGSIFFDEKCHGITRGLNVIYYFLHGPSGLVLLQLVLILVIAVISAHQRFGSTVPLRNPRRISNLEHIEGLSNTYLRAGAAQAVLAIIWHDVRHKLCKILQISPREDDQKLTGTLAAQEKMRVDFGDIKPSSDDESMTKLVEKCAGAVNRKELSEEELRELVAACDKISERADGLLTTGKSK